MRNVTATDALSRAMLSLEGLSCGDAFGESLFLPPDDLRPIIENRMALPGPWRVTDDTVMAISLIQNLRVHGEIKEAWLAEHFARMHDPLRGYGAAMHGYLHSISMRGGAVWREVAGALFNGQGSYGNGAAMRVAPLGAYFADDLDRVVEQAVRSAVPTHSHPEASAGAIATALGAALAWQSRSQTEPPAPEKFLSAILERTPQSRVCQGIEKALTVPKSLGAFPAAMALGNGAMVSAMDTVPFVLWVAAHYMDNYEEALWQTVSGFGDRDTTCAMVGGIVVLRTGAEGIPEEWHRRRELLGELLSVM